MGVELWSATSFKALREEAMSVERWNRLHPGEEQRVPLVTRLLEETSGPFVAVTDNMRAVPDQVSRWVPRPYLSLGTDGFGRSDTRAALRRLFETDKEHVVLGVLTALHRDGAFGPKWSATPSTATGSTPTPPIPGGRRASRIDAPGPACGPGIDACPREIHRYRLSGWLTPRRHRRPGGRARREHDNAPDHACRSSAPCL